MSILAGLEPCHRDDVAGTLEAIDGALADWGTSSDAMRWKPLRMTATIYFVWNRNGMMDHASFQDVSLSAIDELQLGERVWINGERYFISMKQEVQEGIFMVTLDF